jgi:hypothetical protein
MKHILMWMRVIRKAQKRNLATNLAAPALSTTSGSEQ